MATYTHDDVSTAANNAANMLDGLDPDTTSLIDFVVNATLTLLDDKDATVEDVLQENWGDDPESVDAIRDTLGFEAPADGE